MIQVAIVGRPNVGKSTLFNRLTRARDAIVDSTAGLTRDRKYGMMKLNGFDVRLVDTGGIELGARKDEMDAKIYAQCLQAINQSDFVLFVVDGRDGLTALDKEIFGLLRMLERPLMVVANKIDNPSIENNIHEFYELGIDEIIPISAEHGKGINTLTDCMLQKGRDLGWAHQDEETEEEEVIRTALVGRPNVGKSSLLNRLAGEERMIVTDIPGTTRDAVDTLIERPEERNIILIDTAGVRRKARINERIEKFSIGRALEAIKTCDLTLAVLDVSEGITVQDQHLIGYAQEYGRGIITLYNKWDLVQNDASIAKLRMEELKRAKRFVSFSPHLNISALTGKNVKKVFPLIDEVFKDFNSKIGTGRANNILGKAMELRSPPIVKGRPLKLFYTTQVSSRPPTFVVFVNHPSLLPEYYKRFLSNQFREQTGFKLTPIKIIFRKR